MPTPSALRLAALALCAAALAGCPAPAAVDDGGADDPVLGPLITGTPAARSPDLDAARERWEASGLDAYEMTLRRVCFCPAPDYTGPFAVAVRGGEVASVTLDGAAVDDERGETVDDLFDLIEDAYTRKAQSVTVEFDPELGYPTNVAIDYSLQMADEEIGYMVSDLRPAR